MCTEITVKNEKKGIHIINTSHLILIMCFLVIYTVFIHETNPTVNCKSTDKTVSQLVKIQSSIKTGKLLSLIG